MSVSSLISPIDDSHAFLSNDFYKPYLTSNIEENSAIALTLSCVPILGIFPGCRNLYFLHKKIHFLNHVNTQQFRGNKDEQTLALLIVSKRYLISGVLRSWLTATLCGIGIALGIFASPLFIGLAIALAIGAIISACIYHYHIHHYSRIIDYLADGTIYSTYQLIKNYLIFPNMRTDHERI